MSASVHESDINSDLQEEPALQGAEKPLAAANSAMTALWEESPASLSKISRLRDVGRWSSTLPYGYQRADTFTIIEDPVFAPVVRRIFADIAQGKTPSNVAAELNTLGISYPWRIGRKKRESRLWDADVIERLIRKCVYAGRMVNSSGCEIPCRNIPPLVALDVFRQAVAALPTRQVAAPDRRVTHQAVSCRRKQEGIPNVKSIRPKRAQKSRWTPEAVALLHTHSNREVAEKLGLTPQSVALRRKQEGLPNVKRNTPSERVRKKRRSRWTPEAIALLHTHSNREVAEKLGFTPQWVALRRKQEGIPNVIRSTPSKAEQAAGKPGKKTSAPQANAPEYRFTITMAQQKRMHKLAKAEDVTPTELLSRFFQQWLDGNQPSGRKKAGGVRSVKGPGSTRSGTKRTKGA